MQSYLNANNAYGPDEIKSLAVQDNEKAVEILYALYFEKLYAFALSYIKQKELAEEIVEDVFVKFWCNRKAALQINNLTIYLYKAIKNTALNELEKLTRTAGNGYLDVADYDAPSTSSSPLEQLILTEMTQAMLTAIEALPTRCRLIFKLIREDGLSYKEAADVLNVSVHTVNNQMAIAVKRICAVLSIKKESAISASSGR